MKWVAMSDGAAVLLNRADEPWMEVWEEGSRWVCDRLAGVWATKAEAKRAVEESAEKINAALAKGR